MRKSSLMFLLGSLVGAGAAYVATTRKEEILKKVEELQEQIKGMTCLLYTSPSPRD
jgi:uncharacterized membrane protein